MTGLDPDTFLTSVSESDSIHFKNRTIQKVRQCGGLLGSRTGCPLWWCRAGMVDKRCLTEQALRRARRG